LLFLAGFVAVGAMWYAFATTERNRYAETLRVEQSKSDVKLGMQIHHVSGAIANEFYDMEDRDGISSSDYRAVGRNGMTVKVAALPRQTVDVAFFFDKVVQDGIWELDNRPLRGDASISYTIQVYQLTNGKHGSRRFTFTDPHYWATTGGHQFHIHLDKNKPVPNVLQMSSKVLVEPRYEELVNDFRRYGSPAFREKIVAAQAKVRESAGGRG
jgi:hypothetical protein